MMTNSISLLFWIYIFCGTWFPAAGVNAAQRDETKSDVNSGAGKTEFLSDDKKIGSPQKKSDDFWSKTSDTLDESQKALTGDLSSKDWRREKRFAILVNYAAFDLFLPGKKGLSAIMMESEDKAWELEYLKAELAVPFFIGDLGSIKETRISLLRRTFWQTNSFSGYYGLSFNSMSISVGNELLSKLTNGAAPSANLLKLESLGMNFGVGNRWTIWKGISFGADWIGLSQPLLTVNRESTIVDNSTNKAEKDRVEKILRTATYFPRVYLLKMQVGMMF